MPSSRGGSTLLGAVTICVLLAGAITFFLDGRSRPNSDTLWLAGVLALFAGVRAFLLVNNLKRRRMRERR